LFKRLYRGYYELNPDLAVWVNEQWMNVYDMMQSEEVKVPTREERDAFIKDYYKRLREEKRRLREENPWGDDWYDDDEYDEKFGDNEYDEESEAEESDADPREEKLAGEPEADTQKGTDRRSADRESDTQFRLPFDDD
jgi:hypothetical protein